VSIEDGELDMFLKVAASLQIKGLTDDEQQQPPQQQQEGDQQQQQQDQQDEEERSALVAPMVGIATLTTGGKRTLSSAGSPCKTAKMAKRRSHDIVQITAIDAVKVRNSSGSIRVNVLSQH
jgi:hypothetical protein